MRNPNFERLRKILFLDGEPDYLPFYELFADKEVMEAIVGESRCSPRLRMDNDTRRYFESDDNLKVLQRYLAISIRFYHKLGYDYVPLVVPSLLVRDNQLTTVDTAELSRGERTWQDEHRGVIESREDFEKYSWPDLDQIQESFLPLYKFVRDNLPEGMMIIGETPGGVLENVMWLMGTIPFFRALYRDSALLRRMFEKIGTIISFCSKLASEMSMVGAFAMGDDMGYRTGPFMAPENYRKYVFPWQRRCVESVHKHGKPFILHSCGKLDILMEDIIEYLKIDAKHSFEDSSYPVIEYKRKYGDRIAILGGVDMDKISRYSTTEIRGYVKEVIRECAPGGGYALGCGNSVANYVKLENYLTMLDIGRRYGKYPLRI